MTHKVDNHVGLRIRQRRWMIGMTQQQLADRVGIKFQQIQKYETGANRVSSSRLWEIGEALDVSVSYFFEGLDGKLPDENETRGDLLRDKEATRLVHAYYVIPEVQRRRLFDLACVLSGQSAQA